MKKLTKILSSIAGSTVIVGTVTSLATACGQQNVQHAVEDETDRENGVNENTYKAMKDDFVRAYRIKLHDSGITDPAVVSEKLSQLSTQLNKFDTASTAEAPISYTTLTTGLRNFASRVYDVNLTRNSKVSWNDIKIMKDGCALQMEMYMEHAHIDEAIRQKVRRETLDKFEKLETELEAKGYKTHDPLGALELARVRIIECFDSASAEIAQLAGISKIEQFLKKYTFEYKQYNSDGTKYTENRIDTLMEKYPDQFAVGKDISQFMNIIFDITDIETGREHVDFIPDEMVPNYTIRPVLGAISQNAYNNSYTLDIDWTSVKSEILKHPTNDCNEQNATAHLYIMSENVAKGDEEKLKDQSIGEILNQSTKQLTSYTASLSSTKEQNLIESTYFNPDSEEGCIKFKWNPDTTKCAYDYFFDGIASGKTEGQINLLSLAHAGLLISEDNGNSYVNPFDLVESARDKYEENAKQHGESDEIHLTLGEEFVSNMNVVSHVSLDPKDKTHFVSNDFVVEYHSTINRDDNAAKLSLGHYDCSGFQISEDFFLRSSCAYNRARRFYERFFEKNFSDMKTEGGFVIAGECLGEAAHLGLLAKFIITVCKPTSLPLQRVWASVGIASTLGALALGGARLGLYIDKHFKHIAKWEDGCKAIQATEYGQTIQRLINQDKDTYIIIDENGNYDQKEYDDKYEQFKYGDFSEYRDKLIYYQSFQQQPEVLDFLNKADELHIHPKDFNKTFGKFDAGGSQFPVYIGLVAAEVVVNYVQGKCRFHITKKQADKDEQLRKQKDKIRRKKKEEEINKKVFKELRGYEPKYYKDENGLFTGGTTDQFPLGLDPNRATAIAESNWAKFFKYWKESNEALYPDWKVPVQDVDRDITAWLVNILCGNW